MNKKDFINIGENIAAYLITKKIYDSIFKHHRYSSKVLGYSSLDFPSLKRERHTFKNSRGDTLAGYFYYIDSIKKEYVMVFAHGFGRGGHNRYLNLINYFANNGFYVFAYDATANDESEGDDIRGFTQGYLDAKKAIEYVESLTEFKDYPIVCSGHSWGAYSMSNAIKNDKRITGLIAFSGFNKATSIFKANSKIYSPTNNEAFVNYVDNYERIIFNDAADSNAIDSFKNSTAKIVIVHSDDDKTVPTSAGIDLYEEEYKDKENFLFLRFTNRGHGTIYLSKEGKEYVDSFYKIINEYAKKNKLNDEQKDQYASTLLNRLKWNNLLDEVLLDQILDFIKHY